MRLKREDESPPGKRGTCGAKRRGNLGWMVRVIVDDDHASGLTDALEATLRTREVREPVGETHERRADRQSGADSRQRIEHVVRARYAQRHGSQQLAIVF